jgi:hypothetical protein
MGSRRTFPQSRLIHDEMDGTFPNCLDSAKEVGDFGQVLVRQMRLQFTGFRAARRQSSTLRQ